MKKKTSSAELAGKFLDGDKDIKLRDIDSECELEWFSRNLDKYSFGNPILAIPVAFILFIIYLFKY